MTPSLGRIVHYFTMPNAAAGLVEEPLAAIITLAKKDPNIIAAAYHEAQYVVDLHVWRHDGESDLRNVPYDPNYRPGFWTWPPKV